MGNSLFLYLSTTSDVNRCGDQKNMNDKWEFYKDQRTNKWRWRRTAPNGNIVGATTEGYVNKADCEGNARRNGWDWSSNQCQEGMIT